MKTSNWKGYLLETLTVVFSILLALGLNNWNENRKARIVANQHLNGIKEEIKLNYEEVSVKLDYHKTLMDSLKKNPLGTSLILKASEPKSYAWHIAENSNLKEFVASDLYLKLLEIYSLQESLKEHNANASELMAYLNVVAPYHLSPVVDKEREVIIELFTRSKEGWINIFEDTVFYETALKQLYKEILDQI